MTDTGGPYKTILPRATYRVVAYYAGGIAEALATLPLEATITMEVFVEVGGLMLRTSEILGVLLVVVLLVSAPYMLLYVYSLSRRSRAGKLVLRPTH
ncbi:hypothetical protein [Infirmifilum sp.]|uniref:hypothetical protein n=1 Tax=Infirmifilum sp. TaxID=2856575 RepID=UPI003D097543